MSGLKQSRLGGTVFLSYNIPMAWEIILIDWIGNLRNPLMDSLMSGLTYLGSESVIIVLAILASFALIRIKKYNYLVALWISLLGEELIVSLIKYLTERSRPEILTHLIQADSFGFPSGHSSASVVFYGFMGYFLTQELKNRRAKIIAWIILSFIISAVGFSRIYLGVHWPTDVLAGYFVAFVWLTLVIYIFKNRGRVEPLLNN